LRCLPTGSGAVVRGQARAEPADTVALGRGHVSRPRFSSLDNGRILIDRTIASCDTRTFVSIPTCGRCKRTHLRVGVQQVAHRRSLVQVKRRVAAITQSCTPDAPPPFVHLKRSASSHRFTRHSYCIAHAINMCADG
jgi:hypothetical protein